MEIICLANSCKHNGRCIAGINKQGQWIRPVSAGKKRAIDKDTRQMDGREPQILDLIDIPLHSHGPMDGCQPENKLLKPGLWKNNGRVSAKDLLRYCQTAASVLYNDRDHIKANILRLIPSGRMRSLELVHVQDAIFMSDENIKTKWRVSFSNGHGRKLNLRVTDPALCEKLDAGKTTSSNCLVTVSLGPPWSPDKKTAPKCYKFAAGVIELED